MKLTLRCWHAGVFCLGAVLVFTHALVTHFPHSGGPALSRRSFPPETSSIQDDANDADAAAAVHPEPWGTPRKRAVTPNPPANPTEEWTDALAKGNRYLCNLGADVDAPNLASDKTDYSKIDQDYNQDGWDISPDFKLISDEVDNLGLGKQDSWKGFLYTSKEDERDGKESGNVEWKNMFNTAGGGIMCVFNRKSTNPGSREEVRQFSDFVFLLWDHLTADDDAQKKNVNKIIRYQVNADTEELISEATGGVAKDSADARYPGVDYLPDQDQFKALLGSPNGSGVAYFLWTHKRQLGVKTITRIKIFTKREDRPGGTDGWFMVFYVASPPPAQGNT